MLQLKRALAEGSGPVVFARGGFPASNRWRPTDGRQFYYGDCPSGGLECVFETRSACAADPEVREAVERLQSKLPRRHAGNVAYVEPIGWRLHFPSRVVDAAPAWIPPWMAQPQGQSMAGQPPLAGGSAGDLGLRFELISAISGFLWRLSPRMRDEVDRRRLLPPGSPYVGVHIRRGDSCGGQPASPVPLPPGELSHRILPSYIRLCSPAASYVAPIRRVLTQLRADDSLGASPHTLLVASDDPNTADELRAALEADSIMSGLHLTVVSRRPTILDTVIRNDTLSGEHSKRRALPSTSPAAAAATRIEQRLRLQPRGSLALHATTAGAVADIEALASATALVGPFSSQMFRLAFELSYFRREKAVPVETVDIGWCWGGYEKVPVTDREGRSWMYHC